MEHPHYSIGGECSYVNLARCGCIATTVDPSRKPQYNTRHLGSSSWAIHTRRSGELEPGYDVAHQAPTTASDNTDASDMTALGAGLRDLGAISPIQEQSDLGPCMALTASNIFRINQASRGAIGWKDPYGNIVPLDRGAHRTPSTRLTQSSITSSWVFVGDERDDDLVEHTGRWIQHTDFLGNGYPPSLEIDAE